MTVNGERYMITASKEELQELRRALCDRSLKLLSKAHAASEESFSLGRTGEDDGSQIFRDQCNLVRSMIYAIDKLDE